MEENYTEQEYKGSKTFASFFDIFESLVFAIICVVIIFTCFARLSIVDGPSMNPTLADGEYLIVGNLFGTYTPKSGDIIVVHGNYEYSVGDAANKRTYKLNNPIVKRVIATSGQTLKIDYNTMSVYVDGEKLNEEYINTFKRQELQLFMKSEIKDGVFEVVIPDGKAFVMGDNRDNSTDSRIIGFIDYDLIVGKVILRVLPINKFGKI